VHKTSCESCNVCKWIPEYVASGVALQPPTATGNYKCVAECPTAPLVGGWEALTGTPSPTVAPTHSPTAAPTHSPTTAPTTAPTTNIVSAESPGLIVIYVLGALLALAFIINIGVVIYKIPKRTSITTSQTTGFGKRKFKRT